MEIKVRNKVYKKAIARIEEFMSNNAVHWKQDIDFMKHLLEEKQNLETGEIIEQFCSQQRRLFNLCKEQEKVLKELQEFAKIVIDKKVNIYWLLECIICERYNLIYQDNDLAINRLLTQEEFSLLKKVVKEYGKKKRFN